MQGCSCMGTERIVSSEYIDGGRPCMYTRFKLKVL